MLNKNATDIKIHKTFNLVLVCIGGRALKGIIATTQPLAFRNISNSVAARLITGCSNIAVSREGHVMHRVIPRVVTRANGTPGTAPDTIATTLSAAAETFIGHYLPIYGLADSAHKFATSLHNCLIGIQIEMLREPFLTGQAAINH